VRWLGDDRNGVLGDELLHNMLYMVRWFMVMQKPLSLLHVASLPLICAAEPLYSLHVKQTNKKQTPWPLVRERTILTKLHVNVTNITLPIRDELMVHQTVDVKEFRELFD
jgi:hypothetical protein